MPADSDMVMVPREPTEAMMRAWNEAVPDAVEAPHADGWTPPADTTFRARWQAALEASPVGEGEAPFTADDLAQEIRRVDGNNSLGAGALAEALMPFLSRPTPATPEGLREAVTVIRDLLADETDGDPVQRAKDFLAALQPQAQVGE